MRIAAALLCVLACGAVTAQNPVGIFDNHADIGNPKNAGGTVYDAATQSYTIRGSGYNIWFNRDEFQYAYKKIGGDFMLTANFELAAGGKGADGHRKIGWMIRESVDEGAACSNACMHIDGLTVLQWRPYRGMYMRDPEEEIFAPKKGGQIMRLERVGKRITMSIAHPGEPLQVVGSYVSEFKDSVLVGIYVCAHDSNAVAEGRVWNVRIDRPSGNEFSSNPHAKAASETEMPGYRLEVMDVFDGNRKVIRETAARLAAPIWMSSEGKNILFRENDAFYSLPAGGGIPAEVKIRVAEPPIGKGQPESAMMAPDGKTVYYGDISTGTMQIWRMKPDGSGKEQLTFDQYHNWYPRISPDGKWIVFMSYAPDTDPNGHPSGKRVMLRLMPTSGGAPRVIAWFCGGGGKDEMPAWSPDCRHIAFVSNPGMGGH